MTYFSIKEGIINGKKIIYVSNCEVKFYMCMYM